MRKINLRKSFGKIENVYVLLSLLFGISFILITPPGQNPDELTHTQRSYQFSQFDLFSDANSATLEDDLGGYLPKGLLAFFIDNGLLYATDTNHKFEGLDSAISKQYSFKTSYVFQDFKAAALYSPVGYVPYSAVVYLGDKLDASVNITFYFMRLVGLLSSVILMYLAIKITPTGKWVFMSIGLLPMYVSQSASVSLDWAVLGGSSLFISYVLYLSYIKNKLSYVDSAIIFLLTSLLSLSKVTYAPLAIIVLIIPLLNKRFQNFKSLAHLLFPVVIAAAIALFWLSATSHIGGQGLSNVATQKGYILSEPLAYANTLFSTFLTNDDPGNTTYLWLAFFGNFGYLSAPLPFFFVLLSMVSLFIGVCIRDKNESRVGKTTDTVIQSSIFILAAILVTVSISTALYLYFTPVGSPTIRGIQGRYLIPPALLILLSVSCFSDFKDTSSRRLLFYSIACLVLVASLVTAFSRYY